MQYLDDSQIQISGGSISGVSPTPLKLGGTGAPVSASGSSSVSIAGDLEVAGSIYSYGGEILEGHPTYGGGFYTKVATAEVEVTATATVEISAEVPPYGVILGCQILVTEALAVGETWDAEWNASGTVQAIASAQAVAQNTEVGSFFDPSANSPVTTGTTVILVSPNGGGSFTAQGKFRTIIYYRQYAGMTTV